MGADDFTAGDVDVVLVGTDDDSTELGQRLQLLGHVLAATAGLLQMLNEARRRGQEGSSTQATVTEKSILR